MIISIAVTTVSWLNSKENEYDNEYLYFYFPQHAINMIKVNHLKSSQGTVPERMNIC